MKKKSIPAANVMSGCVCECAWLANADMADIIPPFDIINNIKNVFVCGFRVSLCCTENFDHCRIRMQLYSINPCVRTRTHTYAHMALIRAYAAIAAGIIHNTFNFAQRLSAPMLTAPAQNKYIYIHIITIIKCNRRWRRRRNRNFMKSLSVLLSVPGSSLAFIIRWRSVLNNNIYMTQEFLAFHSRSGKSAQYCIHI